MSEKYNSPREDPNQGQGEYEHTRVPDKALKGGGKFWGMYTGEHAAGTEFMIGPLFLLSGVALKDIFLGLLVGNLLAVLCWRLLATTLAGARTPDELRQDLEKALSLIPGNHRLNLHAIYLDK